MVLIPARDEGPRVGAVVRRAREAAPDLRVVVVENGSQDDTASQARAAGATVIHSRPGYARALHAGFCYAVAAWDADPSLPREVVQLDADGQHPPESIPELRAALAHADLVVGSRYVQGRVPSWMPWHTAWAARGAARWTQLLTGLSMRDVTSGLHALGEATVRSFARRFPAEVADANVLARAWGEGLRVVEVPVAMSRRVGGHGMHAGLHSALYLARMLALTHREARRRPQAGPGGCSR